MKKLHLLTVLLAASLLTLTLTACGAPATPQPPSASGSEPPAEQTAPIETNGSDADGTADPNTDSAAGSEPSSESNVLVVWFSRVGVTPFSDDVDATTSASVNLRDGELVGNMQYLAEFIAGETDGDMFQIVTEKEYPTDYRDTTDLAKEEQDNDERPALASHVEDMDQYDIIFLGYPNWWGTLPQAVMTFLEEYDFSGKTIVPFCSHGGSRLGRGPQDIAALCPDTELLDGLAVSGSNVSGAQQDVRDWLTGLNLPQKTA